MAIEAFSAKFGPLNKQYWGTAPPSVAGDGTYQKGDIVWNNAPAGSQPPAWLCSATGSPGTWKALGNVAA